MLANFFSKYLKYFKNKISLSFTENRILKYKDLSFLSK